eukprot:TRINITY_DN1780_c0_g2_i5.p1 TRINITY_DN1780_c0_g2~~TRINITY_DN1780_c0_g2_i5.p1  ORF type:complete len:564 (-),score=132.71 TRINITY_DN1780_c0_g2_i5:109-1800(-)
MSSDNKDNKQQKEQDKDDGGKIGAYTLENVRLRGWVFKRGASSWQKRWCVLTNSKIIYFKTKTETEPPQGTISLVGAKCSVLDPDDVIKREFCFTIKSLNKLFYFSCDSSKEQAKWIGAVTLSVQTLRVLKDPSIAPHSFKKVSFTRPVFCCSCESFIWGLVQGFMCKSCGVCIHKKCVFKLPDNCKNDAIEKLSNPNIELNQIVEIQTPLTPEPTPTSTLTPLDSNVQTTTTSAPSTPTTQTTTVTTNANGFNNHSNHSTPPTPHNSFLDLPSRERLDSAPHMRKNEAAQVPVRKFSDGSRQEPKHFPVVNAAIPYRSKPISFVSSHVPKVPLPPPPVKNTPIPTANSNFNNLNGNNPNSNLPQVRSAPAMPTENLASYSKAQQPLEQQQQIKTQDSTQNTINTTQNTSINTETSTSNSNNSNTTTIVQPKEPENTNSPQTEIFNPRNLPTIRHTPSSSPQKGNSPLPVHRTVRTSMKLIDTLNVDELKLQLKAVEDREIKEINDVGTKYEILIHEIMDEFSSRELKEILGIEKEYETRREEILKEITLRESLQNGHDNGVE